MVSISMVELLDMKALVFQFICKISLIDAGNEAEQLKFVS